MKRFLFLFMAVLMMAGTAKADVEWTVWEGSITQGNVQGASKLDFSTLAVGDMIYVYGSGTLSKAIYRISGSSWDTWTNLAEYSPAVSDGDNYYHVITEEFLTNFNYSSDDTKSWAVGNWDGGTITKVTIKKGMSMIKTELSNTAKSADTFDYTIAKNDFSLMEENDYLYLPTTKRDEVDGKKYKIEFKEGENDWTTYTTLWGPTHDAIWKVDESAIEEGIKNHPLYVYGELYNTTGVYLYHPVPSFSIGSIGYATFSASQEVTAPNTVTAYKASVSGSSVVLTPFTDNVIPANTGAIIAGDEGSVLEFVASSTGSTESSGLTACMAATDVSSLAESGYDLYVLYQGTAESEAEVSLSEILGSWGNWHPTEVSWNSETYTITYNGTASGEGGWAGKDWSGYDYLRLNFSSNTLNADATFYVAYQGHDENTTEATLAQGAVTTVNIPLNSDYKNSIGNFSMYSYATSGSLTFESAALVDSDGATVAEFRKTTSGTLAANKAYLKLGSGSSGSARLSIVFNDEDSETTGVLDVQKHTTQSDNVYYNLRGMQVDKPTKGLYIMNGKKVIVK